MALCNLTAISPIDGRYRDRVQALEEYFSELALIRYRVMVEVEYFIALCQLPLPQLEAVDRSLLPRLRGLYTPFTLEQAQRVKAFERQTNHDVKAVEYLLKEELDALGLGAFREFIHFGLTSQDVNNTAFPAMLRDALAGVYLPLAERVIGQLAALSREWRDVPMLARTHGQPASPTRLGKEIAVFVDRLGVQLQQLRAVPHSAKFGGATGNFNAHLAAYPQVDWVAFANRFVNETLGLHRTPVTTQIEPYDNLAAALDALKRINTILIDLCRDAWAYISMDYFKQRLRAGEVGSSAMPHKVNPIDFENAEGNLGVANALFEHLSAKLPISRLQRDLTDSTVMRNLGTPIAHTVLALGAIERGLAKLVLNPEAIHADLARSWAVVAEAIQTILRREGYPNPYEALRDLTRTHGPIGQRELHEFVDGLGVSAPVKEEIKRLTPFTYLGAGL